MRVRASRHLALPAAACVAAVLGFAAPAPAAASTYHVSPQGSDAAPGTVDQPFLTIGKAAQAVGSGDTVLVASGTYHETVTVPVGASGVTFRGEGPTRPVVDGEGTRHRGFVVNSAKGVTIAGFEVTDQTEAGIYVNGHGTSVTDNLVHHIGSPGRLHSQGIKVFYGAGSRITDNIVHSIGPGGESFGIWLIQTRDAHVDANTVYLVRKEGIRDWMGLDNRISNNRAFLNWAGLSLNTSTGSTVVNNYVYDNAVGIVTKHISYKTVLAHWQLSQPRWSRIWSNTIWRTTGTSLALGQSEEPFDYVDVRNNVFADAGLAYVHDMPHLRGSHVNVDGNAYAPAADGRPTYFYKSGWSKEGGIAHFDQYRSQLGWDQNGRVIDVELVDPAGGNLDYPASSQLASGGVELPDGSGRQLGARGLGPAAATWTPYAMTPVDSSSKNSWWTREHLGSTTDDNTFSYWLSETSQNEYVTYDFGQTRTFDHLVLSVFSHGDKRNIRGYRFEVSDDNQHWTTVLEGQNPDPAGASYKYELPEPATGRYLRFTLRDTFCDSYAPRTGCGPFFVFSDLKAGSINVQPSVSGSISGPPSVSGSINGPPSVSGSINGPPSVSVSVPRQRLSKIIRKRALATRVQCDKACTVSSTLFEARARKKGHAQRRPKLARGAAQLAAGARTKVYVRLTRAAGRRLARTDQVKVRLLTTAVGSAPGASTVRRTLKLRR